MLVSNYPLQPDYQLSTSLIPKSKSTALKEQASQPLTSTDADSEKNDNSLSVSEQREIQQLKNRDREVKAHELAHLSVGGRYVTSAAKFSYEKGSDGQLYAVAGEVSINTSEFPGDPRATLLKAQVIARAALAPANPSAQDRNVAAQATSMILQARVELARKISESTEIPVGSKLDLFA